MRSLPKVTKGKMEFNEFCSEEEFNEMVDSDIEINRRLLRVKEIDDDLEDRKLKHKEARKAMLEAQALERKYADQYDRAKRRCKDAKRREVSEISHKKWMIFMGIRDLNFQKLKQGGLD